MLFGKDYDNVQVGESKQLPAGGYICRIRKAEQALSKTTGLPMVVAYVDIVEGEYKGFVSRKYQEKMKYDPNAQFPPEGTVRVVTKDANDNTKKMFKSFCTAVEESNGSQVPRDDNEFIKWLSGKFVGILYGREQWQGRDGKLYWSTKPRYYRSVQAIQKGDFDKPEDVPYKPNNNYGGGNSFGSNPFGGQAQSTQSQSQNTQPMGNLFGDPPVSQAQNSTLDQFAQVDDGLGAFYPDDSKIPF